LPPPPPRGNANLLLQAVVLGAALAFFCLAQPTDLLVCPLRRFTGYLCPLCGLTRGLCAVGHAQFGRAVALHTLSPAVFILFVASFAMTLARLAGLRLPAVPQARVFHVLLAVLLAYGALRIIWPAV
jgi:hypothetical protein